jgi:hypothetical protein
MKGNSTGAEPVAMTMFLAVSSVGSLALAATRIGVGGDEGRGAGEDGDFAGFGELGDAGGEFGDDGVLLLEERGEVEFDGAEFHAVFGGVLLREDVVFGGGEEGFARNAADVEASAAEGGAFLDEGDLEAELGGAEGADVAAGAGANYDHVESERGGHGGKFKWEVEV